VLTHNKARCTTMRPECYSAQLDLPSLGHAALFVLSVGDAAPDMGHAL